MLNIKHAIKDILRNLSPKDRYLSGLALSSFDYYSNIGKYKKIEVVRSLKVGTDFCSDNFNYRILPHDATQADEIIWEVVRDPHNYKYLHETFLKYPLNLSKYYARKYVDIFKKKGHYEANKFIRNNLGIDGKIDKRVQLTNDNYFDKNKPSRLYLSYCSQYEILYKLSKSQIETLSKKLAVYVSDLVYFEASKSDDNFKLLNEVEITPAHQIYKMLAGEFKALKLDLPYFGKFKQMVLTEREALIAIAKVTDFEWWLRQLNKRQSQQKEHLAIAYGQVQKKTSPYSSKNCQNEWLESKKRNREWAKNQVIENEETGEQFELTLQIDKSNANPAIRRCELMVRARGFEEIAKEYGYVGAFVTITAPSKYHACHNKGGFVDNWIGCSPRITQRYLCNVWAKIRSKLCRQNIKIFGFRVTEPHHDGTPHWHLLIFMLPENKEIVKKIMMDYALEEDAQESGAYENRFKFVDIDNNKGSATGYIAKYISKNIDGYALDNEVDNETGENLKTVAKAITAWASRWRIRQFQQIGGAPVTVYRELRRLKGKKVENNVFDQISIAADTGNWAAYTELQGGPLVSRIDLKVRASYEERFNQYDEKQPKINGLIYNLKGAISYVCTRLIKWRIIRKKSNKKEVDLKNRANGAAWSSVNNCTLDFIANAAEEQRMMKKRSKMDAIEDELIAKGIDFEEWLNDPSIRKRKKATEKGKERLQFNNKVKIIEEKLALTPRLLFFPNDIEWTF